MASYNLNEILKSRDIRNFDSEETALGNRSRVKVLSPMRQVAKRFARNRLAVLGLLTLVLMFVTCFIVPLFYAYGQSEAIGAITVRENADYAFARYRSDFSSVVVNDSVVCDATILPRVSTEIETLQLSEKNGVAFYGSDGHAYLVLKDNKSVYRLFQDMTSGVAAFGSGPVKIGTYNTLSKQIQYDHESQDSEFLSIVIEKCVGNAKGSFEYNGATYSFRPSDISKQFEIFAESQDSFRYFGEALGDDFESVATATNVGDVFEFGKKLYYVVSPTEGSYEAHSVDQSVAFRVYSNLSFDTYVTSLPLTDEFKSNALMGLVGDGTFEASAILDTDRFQRSLVRGADADANSDSSSEDEVDTANEEKISDHDLYQTLRFTIKASEADEDVFIVSTASETPYAELNSLAVRRTNGSDTMDLDLKHAIREKVHAMRNAGIDTDTLAFRLPLQNDDGTVMYDDGAVQYDEEAVMKIQTDTSPLSGGFSYKITTNQRVFSKEGLSKPSSRHILGTDANGFDVFARLLYGGRISLLVGFVVVILQCLIGVILGGLAGYYGGWVDNLVMRLVDVFYCLPYLPVMIVVSTLMDAGSKMDASRIFIMMIAMGFLGWARIARLVRGQILSLREQEFMVATEATGLPVSQRIFRHLLPNVMPQLIVAATLGLGEAILLESTLSFLGLGVRFPTATWGSMISVVSLEHLEDYTFIWIPVGLAICLTVIAFNFVGDGLRDAFDPKAKK